MRHCGGVEAESGCDGQELGGVEAMGGGRSGRSLAIKKDRFTE